ncbi:MAG: hypothetical protein OHK0054_10460 [Sideroxydans sp.]
MAIYRRFIKGGVPDYLARHYWWAYLWDRSIWFFDHQPIINAILFGQYERLMRLTLAQVERKADAHLLQLTCVYGKLTPRLVEAAAGTVDLCDVAGAQLRLARRKVDGRVRLARMNAESLAYADDAFDQIILFFLFHELPPEARQHVYDEMARVLKPGGSVLITEYAATPQHHPLYRFPLTRWILGTLEPFLPGFWQEEVTGRLEEALHKQGKRLAAAPHEEQCFGGFYRVMRFEIAAD